MNGLSVNGFTGVQVEAAIGTSNTITGNYIGIDATGTTAGAGQGSAIGIRTDPSVPNNTIGSTGAGRNVVGGNAIGIDLHGTGNTVRNNFVGNGRQRVERGAQHQRHPRDRQQQHDRRYRGERGQPASPATPKPACS